jgi:peptidoglycan hydrolase CwlO-like protein
MRHRGIQMSSKRDIIIERFEQKLAARDKEIENMKESLRESIIEELEKRFADRIKLRESTLDEIKTTFSDKVNEIIDMNRSLRDSILEEQKMEKESLKEYEDRMNRIEHRLVELNNAYEGVMKELLDQKSVIQELTGRKKTVNEIEAKTEKAEQEKPKQKGEYIVAENYVQKVKKKPQQIIEAEEGRVVLDDNAKGQTPSRIPTVKRSERVHEGVEIFEIPRKR